jgi:hypothetical protein
MDEADVRRGGWAYYLGLLLAVPAGVGLGRVVGHPGDPPHVFTLLAWIAGGFTIAGIILEVVSARPGQSLRMVVSVGLLVWICSVMQSEPFIHFDGTTVGGLLEPAAWFLPTAVGGAWFARHRRWPQVVGAAVFLMACAALMAFNMCWSDPAGFISKIRT